MTKPATGDRVNVTLGIYDQGVQQVTEQRSNFAPLAQILLVTRPVAPLFRYRLVRVTALIDPPHNPTFIPNFRLYRGKVSDKQIICAARENDAKTYNDLYESGPLSVVLYPDEYLTFAWGEETPVDSGKLLIGTAICDIIPPDPNRVNNTYAKII